MINHRKFVDLPSWKMGGFSIIINNTNTGWWLSPTPLKNMSSSMGMINHSIYDGK
jgi:hypothetical protein